MKTLFVNLPLVEWKDGILWTGPNAGSCWPHTSSGLYCYVPFPFWMANAVAYLRAHGQEADLFDAWAYRMVNFDVITEEVKKRAAPGDMLSIEASTAIAHYAFTFAQWAKCNGYRVTLTGPHMAANAEQTAKECPFVDHIIVGEIELAMMAILAGNAPKIIRAEPLQDIDFAPYRDPAVIRNYLDPSMVHTPIQLQVNGSRGCPFHCTYCVWPQTSYGKFRLRSAQSILTEIADMKARHYIGSIFFDDETWGLGPKDRLRDLCAGLKGLAIPWSMMTRSDTWTHEEMDLFIDSGCVGVRLGVESGYQRLLDRVGKGLDVGKSFANLEWLLTNHTGLHVRLLTMIGLPGETPDEEEADALAWADFVKMGTAHGNRVDVQTAECTAFPGTALWEQSKSHTI